MYAKFTISVGLRAFCVCEVCYLCWPDGILCMHGAP